jgi:hypothetical protein
LHKELFEITDEEFLEYKNYIISKYKNSDKLQFKDYNMRNNIYMLVDNLGNAWIPKYEKSDNDCENRVIIGNINNKDDWNDIIYYIKKGK